MPPSAVDAGLLNVALELEHSSVEAYRRGLDLTRGDAARWVRTFLAQEREHVRRLARRIEALGGTPREPKLAEEYARSFPRLAGGRDALTFAVDLKGALVRSYLDAVPNLSDRGLRALAASIAANEAEQMSILLRELGKPPLPHAFVTGKS